MWMLACSVVGILQKTGNSNGLEVKMCLFNPAILLHFQREVRMFENNFK